MYSVQGALCVSLFVYSSPIMVVEVIDVRICVKSSILECTCVSLPVLMSACFIILSQCAMCNSLCVVPCVLAYISTHTHCVVPRLELHPVLPQVCN